MSSSQRTRLSVGDRLQVSIEKVAHGGHFIARYQSAVIFVRHAIPGEEVIIEVTSVGSSFNRGEVVEVLIASLDRVTAPCSFAHRSGCGGCDFQHITPARQRSLKADVMIEQFARIASMKIEVEVEEVGESLGWRTRFSGVTSHKGELGFFAARSHTVVPVDNCLILLPDLNYQDLSARTWAPDQRVEVSASSQGERVVAIADTRAIGPSRIIEGIDISHEVIDRKVLEVSQKSFWQSHKDAPRVLTQAVRAYAGVKLGDRILDLYGGVGLFTADLIDLVGPTGAIDLVEGAKSATANASQNFRSYPNVKIHTGDVVHLIKRFAAADVVILDPPREGAGKGVLTGISALAPRAIIYVACDPAALARDTTYLAALGYELSALRSFDLFPMTHHIESVALYVPTKVS